MKAHAKTGDLFIPPLTTAKIFQLLRFGTLHAIFFRRHSFSQSNYYYWLFFINATSMTRSGRKKTAMFAWRASLLHIGPICCHPLFNQVCQRFTILNLCTLHGGGECYLHFCVKGRIRPPSSVLDHVDYMLSFSDFHQEWNYSFSSL